MWYNTYNIHNYAYNIGEYIHLHQKCDKGSNWFSRFYLKWYSQAHHTASEELLAFKTTLVFNLYTQTISQDTWDTLVSTILYVSFNKIQDHVSSWLETVNEDVASSFLDCDKEGEEEDEVSLMRLGGWALFSCIQYREKALKSKSKTKHTPLKKIEAQTADYMC